MGKMIVMLTILFLTQVGLVIFLGADIPGSSLFNAILGFENWSQNGLIDYLGDGLLVTGTITLAVGAFLRTEFPIYAGIASIFFSFVFGLVELYQQLVANSVLTGGGTPYILFIIMGPLAIAFLVISLDYARGRD